MRFGQYAPHSGPAVPLFVAGDAEPPPELATGSLFKADALDGGAASHSPSLFWAAALVGGWARQYFSSTQPVVASWTDALEAELERAALAARAAAAAARAGAERDDVLAASNRAAAAACVARWRELLETLVLSPGGLPRRDAPTLREFAFSSPLRSSGSATRTSCATAASAGRTAATAPTAAPTGSRASATRARPTTRRPRTTSP